MKKFEVLGKERHGEKRTGEGNCITYAIVTSHIFANNAKEAEGIFIDLHPECDEVLHRETKELEMNAEETAEQSNIIS